MEKFFISIKVSREAFKKRDFTGNHIRLILNEHNKFFECFVHSQGIKKLMAILYQIQNYAKVCFINRKN